MAIRRLPAAPGALRTVRCGCAGTAASAAAPGMIGLSCDSIWQPLQMPSAKLSLRGEERCERVAQFRPLQDRRRPAAAGAEHVAVAEAAAGDEAARNPASRARPAIRSLMCTSTALKPARSNADRGFDLAVDALLAQDRHPRPHAGGDVGRGDVLGGIEGELRAQCRAHRSGASPRAPRRRTRGCRAGAASRAVTDHQASNNSSQRHSTSVSPSERTRIDGAFVGRAMRCAQSIRPWRATQVGEFSAIRAGDLHDGAELLVEQRAERILAPAVEADVQAADASRTPSRTGVANAPPSERSW